MTTSVWAGGLPPGAGAGVGSDADADADASSCIWMQKADCSGVSVDVATLAMSRISAYTMSDDLQI